MKIFLLFSLAIGLVSADKLDRTYLPPPGSKFSGGSPGDIQVPLEYSKETYLTGQPLPEGIPELELGINRRPKPVGNAQSSTPGFSKFRNSSPQTTTSYAITQTTTFAPEDDDYEDQGSGFLNATGLDQTGSTNYPQEQTYQRQPNQGQSIIAPTYSQNQQSTLAPYGTTQRPVFASNRKPEPYLPPVSNNGRIPSGQNAFTQNNLGYPSGQPLRPTTYQDGQQFSTTYRPLLNQPSITSSPANQQNQFSENVNIPSSTAAPQFQGERFGTTNMNPQRFGSTSPQQNLDQSSGSQNFATSNVGPQYQDQTLGSVGQNQFVQNQNLPSTVAPQYQNGQRIINPESNLQNQYFSSSTPLQYQDGQRIYTPGFNQQRYQQNQNNYPNNQNFASSTAATQYQNGQQFNTPASVPQGQYLGNQVAPSTVVPVYQGGQQFVKPGTPQVTVSSNQQVFGSRLLSQQNEKYPEKQNFPSSTTSPQFQAVQKFVTSGADKPIQFLGNQNVPSTTASQYQDGQRVFRPETSRNVFAPNQGTSESQVPSQQNQNQYIGNQAISSTTAAPQVTDSVQLTTPGSVQRRPMQQNQYQSQGQQNYPSSTAVPQYQFTSSKSVQRNQYAGNQIIPGSQFQNGQLFSTPGVQVGYDSALPSQQGIRPSGNQQFPSTATPQYQSTFAPTAGLTEQEMVDANQYSTEPNYNQRLQSSTIAPQQFVTESSPQYNNGIQTVPGIPSSQGTGTQRYGTSTSDYDQDPAGISGPFPTGNYATAVSKIIGQARPERPQAASDRSAEILNYENVLTPEGYSYSYDTSNGIHADETGVVGNGTRAQGAYSYTGDDGKVYTVFYSADENGFQPRGDHLPTAPPIPEAIQRVIEQANKDKESGISDDGYYNEEKYGHKKYDGKLKQLRPKNKKGSPLNGSDISARYDNKVGTQNQKQFVPTGENQAYRDDEAMDSKYPDNVDSENVENQDNVSEKVVNNQRVLNKPSTKVKNLPVEDNGRKYSNKNNLNQRPELNKEQDRDIAKDDSISDIFGDDDDMDVSYDLDERLDVINYDPNARTDFHGTNKYLPKPKQANKLKQSDRRRPMLPSDNVKMTAIGLSKSGRPSNRKGEISGIIAFEDEKDFIDDERVRKPSIKNKMTQKAEEQSKFGQPGTLDNGDAVNSYDVNTSEYYASKDDRKTPKGSQTNQGRNQYENRRNNKPVKSKNDGYGVITQNGNADFIANDEKGYEYIPPQNKLNSGESVQFPPRNSVTERQKYIPQKDSGFRKEGNKYVNVSPEKTEGGEKIKTTGEYGTTPLRLSSGRVQSTSRPQYEEQETIAQNGFNKPINSQSSRRPGNKISFNKNAPIEGASTVNDAFVSTTPLQPSVSDVNSDYQVTGQYQPFNKPTDDNSRAFEENTQDNVRRPGTNEGSRTISHGQLPSTTYRPNYVFGDRTLAPKDSVTVDGFGRPISSTTPEINDDLTNKQPGREETFRPTVGRFGVTGRTQGSPGVYEGSTSAPGEDFSGPKQSQRFDPDTGYYY